MPKARRAVCFFFSAVADRYPFEGQLHAARLIGDGAVESGDGLLQLFGKMEEMEILF
jgi:hypothetical protein